MTAGVEKQRRRRPPTAAASFCAAGTESATCSGGSTSRSASTQGQRWQRASAMRWPAACPATQPQHGGAARPRCVGQVCVLLTQGTRAAKGRRAPRLLPRCPSSVALALSPRPQQSHQLRPDAAGRLEAVHCRCSLPMLRARLGQARGLRAPAAASYLRALAPARSGGRAQGEPCAHRRTASAWRPPTSTLPASARALHETRCCNSSSRSSRRRGAGRRDAAAQQQGQRLMGWSRAQTRRTRHLNAAAAPRARASSGAPRMRPLCRAAPPHPPSVRPTAGHTLSSASFAASCVLTD